MDAKHWDKAPVCEFELHALQGKITTCMRSEIGLKYVYLVKNLTHSLCDIGMLCVTHI